MDFAILTEHFVPVVVAACLGSGYCIKHASFLKWIPNGDIPVILGAFGAVANLAVSGFSVEAAVYGMIMGLSATGMHQAFTRWIDGEEKE